MRTQTTLARRTILVVVIGLLAGAGCLVATGTAAAANAAPAVVPALQEWTGGTGTLRLTPTSRVVVPANGSQRLRQLAGQVVDELAELTGLRVTTAVDEPKAGDIALRTDATASFGAASDELRPEAYRLEVSTSGVTIVGGGETGVYYGTRSLLQILVRSGSTVPVGTAVDYPNYAVRGFMLDVGRRYFTPEFLRSYIRWMGWLKLNTFQLHLNDNEIQAPDGDWSRAYSAFRLKTDNPQFAGLAATDGSYDRATWNSFEDTAAAHGVTLVPEVDAPAHARAFIAFRPELGLNGGNSDHLDLAKPAATEFMKSVFAEFTPWFRGKSVHIGADEYLASAERYKTYVNTMSAYVRGLGKRVHVWGSFSRMSGSAEGYDRDLTVNSWNNSWYGPNSVIADGYDLINSNDAMTYVVPFADYYHGQGLDASWLLSSWEPHVFPGGQDVTPRHPRLKGAMPAVWNDLVRANYTQFDVHRLVEKTFAVLAQKQWSGTKAGTDYPAFATNADALGRGAGTGFLPDTTDLARGRTTTASSVEAATTQPGNATDGVDGSRWASAYHDDEWLQVNLGSRRTVTRVLLDWEAAYGRDYDIEISDDGTTWQTLVQRRGRTSAGVDEVAVAPTSAQYVRMRGIARGTDWGYSLYRFEVRSEAVPVDLARFGNATASSEEAPWLPAAHAIDGDGTTRWSSAYRNDEWLRIDLGTRTTVNQVLLDWETAYGRDYDIELSDDATTWHTVAQRRGRTTAGVDEVTFTPATARFIRVHGIARGTGWGYSLYRAEVRYR